MTERIESHEEQALSRLLAQHKDKPNFEALITALTGPAQDLEDALWQLFTERAVDTAIGTQLDAIGAIVLEERAGLDDDTYRRHLRARIATNKSEGRFNDLLNIARLILGDVDAQRVLEPQYPAALAMRVLGYAVSDDLAATLIRFLRAAVKGGVRILLEHVDAEDDEAFSLALAAFADGAISSGADTITVDSTEGFPAAGDLDIDVGLAAEETVSYVARTATEFILDGVTANAHDSGACVQLADGPGKGLGDTNDANEGGLLASVQE